MRKRKAIIGFVMTLTIGFCSIIGEAPVSYGMSRVQEAIISEGAVEISEITGDAMKIASLFEPMVNASTKEVSFSYIYFGSYPQSEVTGEALTQEIIEAEYVSGDAVVDGVKYHRITKEDAWTYEEWREEQVKDIPEWEDEESFLSRIEENKILFYNWDNGEYRYFKYEPIKWKVIKIEDNIVDLTTDMIIDEMQYHKDKITGTLFYSGWQQSSIRQWLNTYNLNGFAGMAFNERQWESIYSQYEKVGLKYCILSGWEYECRSAMRAELTEYAFAKGGMKQAKESMYSEYWLENDGNMGQHAGGVNAWGNFGSDGIYMYNVSNYKGVVPYIQLDISNTDVWKYAGADAIPMEPLLPIESQKPDVTIKPEETQNVSEEPNITIEPTASAVPSVQPSDEPMIMNQKGDVNLDGKVELIDAQMVLKMALKIEIMSEERKRYADMDEDAKVTLTDAQKVLRKALKIDM